MPRCSALIVAAGHGARFGSDMPKQYQPLAGVPILRRTVAAFASHPGVDTVRVVIQPVHATLFADAVRGIAVDEPVAGGSTRQESCHRGLESLTAAPPDLVLIHDAARPLIDHDTITRVIAALEASSGAIAALPVVDTLKRGDHGIVAGTVDRTSLWRAQTPQGFHFTEILGAHRAASGAELTDDAAVAERSGLEVALVAGHEDNLKVTTTADLERAEMVLSRRAADLSDIRVGTGFDVHRFGPGDHVILCGVAIPHGQSLEGHSDADVGLHALTDAILGALGAGDIGSHFPPSDPQWRGADSALFLRHAVDLVRERGGRLSHADVTLICERPRIGPHRSAMVSRLASLLDIDVSRVSVKATTTESLGFTGRREGIAAQAAATVIFA